MVMTEKKLDDTALLQEIATAFDQYNHLTHEEEDIRKHLFRADAASDEQNQQQLDDNLKAEYLEAVRANAAARRRYADAAGSASLQAHETNLSTQPAADKAPFLDQHLDLLRLRKTNAQLTILQDEMDAILSSSSSVASVQLGTSTVEPAPATFSSENGQGEPARSITQSIQALEVAVVHARHEATQQRALLDGAKSSTAEPGKAPAERHLAAMSVVRQILTTWLQESLDRCQEGPDALNDQAVDGTLLDGEDWDKQIGIQYDQYVEARRRLLSAATDLRSPLPEKESQSPGGNKSVEQPLKPRATDLTNTVEKCLLPSLQQQRMSSSHLTLMDEQLRKESATTINMLDRHSDESQLLQAFPLLAGSGRFVHARSTFGDKQNKDTGTETQDEVSTRLEAWMFAAEAADVASLGAAEKHLKQGKDAMDEVWRGFAAIRLFKEART
ncbi:uncharacterized protein PV07_12112 [Cladophialophora immunda]|uniref:Uncharacterized protein n=1 Tax=Cladophialophora immunda TaxID=569365 RepID=A0A0D1Z3F6_9EURO|nr:uncharacterized protein PV07_12112 [Cladophialophora immunda]KIW22201.1 hypothetical protein PV07_12112 [Cladophialophora immunda]